MWWNHYYHFHVRVKCPTGASDCEGQKPLRSDDGCRQELSNWFEKLKRAAIAGAMQPPALASKPRNSLTMAKLPKECSTVLAAGGFEPQPVNASSLPPQVLKALASKESDPAARAALIASMQAAIPLPDRNPRR
jgi:penicillin-insensitive murein endopeptidase